MGSVCSTEREEGDENNGNGAEVNKIADKINNNVANENILPNFVEIKNYKEYNYKMETMKRKIMDKLDKFKKSRRLTELNLINR